MAICVSRKSMPGSDIAVLSRSKSLSSTGVVQTMSQSLDIMYKLGLQEGFWPVSAVAVGYSRTPLEKREVPLKKLVTNFIG